MPQNKVDNTPATQPTASEMRSWYEKHKKQIEKYEDANNALKNLRDVTKSSSYRTISNYSKETVKSYLKNISSNESNLRNLSRFLFYRSEVYYRLVKYYAGQLDLSIRSVIPNYSLTEDNDKDAVLQSFEETSKKLDEMNIQYEFFKAAIVALREDAAYYCAYYTEGEGLFLLPLDPDYAKIQGEYSDGSYGFAYDMSYFRRNKEFLEYWGEPWQSMNSEYESTGEKWQTVPEEYGVCVKFRAEDWETVVPPFAPMFIDIINLLDLAEYQAVQEAANIYKLIWLEMETLNGTNEPDDWKVNPQIMIEYFDRMLNEALPDYVSAAIVPGKLKEISFPNDASTDVTKVEKATSEILNTAGGAQVLNSSTVSGTTAFTGSMKVDSEFTLSSLIPQIERIVNRLLKYYCSNPCRVKFFEISTFTKEEYKKTMMESAQYGLPTKLMVNNLNGFSEMDTLALNFLEEECLGLSDIFRPLQSSYTTTSDSSGGGQTKDDSDLTDDGEASRDKRDNSN